MNAPHTNDNDKQTGIGSCSSKGVCGDLALIFGVDIACAGNVSNINVANYHSSGNGAWPPPALKGLPIMTFVVFVVHPDGLTWILLGLLW